MKLELEAKFLNINPIDIRQKLTQLGFSLVQPEFMMKRRTFQFPETPGVRKWARVRNEGDKITIAIKEITDSTRIDGTREIELTVNSFESASELVRLFGVKESSYQENLREKWSKGDVEVTIDTWPGLQPYIEIESSTEQEVRDVSASLDFNFADALFGSSDIVYEKVLGIPSVDFIKLPEVTFNNPPKKTEAY